MINNNVISIFASKKGQAQKRRTHNQRVQKEADAPAPPAPGAPPPSPAQQQRTREEIKKDFLRVISTPLAEVIHLSTFRSERVGNPAVC